MLGAPTLARARVDRQTRCASHICLSVYTANSEDRGSDPPGLVQSSALGVDGPIGLSSVEWALADPSRTSTHGVIACSPCKYSLLDRIPRALRKSDTHSVASMVDCHCHATSARRAWLEARSSGSALARGLGYAAVAVPVGASGGPSSAVSDGDGGRSSKSQ